MARIRTAAIIGGGVAGLAAASRMVAAGIMVTVFDKGRRVGGRLCTRHADGFVFNHGCQFFTARDPDFIAAVISNSPDLAACWPAAGVGRWVGVPDMAAVAARLAVGLDVRQRAPVRAIERAGEAWGLKFDDGVAGPFDVVVLAIPAPQAAVLLADLSPRITASLAGVRMAPCWAVMLGFDEEVAGPETAAPAGGPISWMARENSRPHARARPVSYTIHGSPSWSEARLEWDAASVISLLTQAAGLAGLPSYAASHRWRYALVERPVGEPFLWDAALNLGLCGDWCLGGRLEAAYLSGRALGIRLSQ